MQKSFVLLGACWMLTSCMANHNQLVSFDTLPKISEPSNAAPAVSTQAELLQQQPLEEKSALSHFIKTHQASILETNQSVQFPFGRVVPEISCLPLHACDIALQTGEKVTGVYPGDTSRWLFEEAVSGNEEKQVHVLFKPKEENIATNVIITTTQRTYHLNLSSNPNTSIKYVSFYYPDDFLQAWKDLQETTKKKLDEQEAQHNEFSIMGSTLHFNYRIETALFSHRPCWMPVRAFNNGKQVYIQMPEISETMPLPALFILGNDSKPQLVNYRIKKPYYIVDRLFQKAVLISGTGNDAERVTIIDENRA